MQSRIFIFNVVVTAALTVLNPAHSDTEMPNHATHGSTPSDVLTAPGNDAFAAMQEVVNKLMSDPKTDWKRVNLEALRQHLRDMANTTLYVDVVEQRPIRNGITFTVRATSAGAAVSLDRTMSAHSEVLKQETGWGWRAQKLNKGWSVEVTSLNPDEAVKIQGLGYIGIMVLGNHHQPHHWQMAIGANPHHAH